MTQVEQSALEKWLDDTDPSQDLLILPDSEGFREPGGDFAGGDVCVDDGDDLLDVDGFRAASLPASDPAPAHIETILKRLETMELELTAIDSREPGPDAGFKLEPFKLEVRPSASAVLLSVLQAGAHAVK